MMAILSQTQSPPSANALDVANPAFTEEGMVVLMLNESGFILNCNTVAGKLLGGMTSQLLWQPITKFLPQLVNTALMLNGKINPRLRFLSRIGHLFEVTSADGESFKSRVFFNEVENYGQQNLCLVILPEAREALPS
jgi:hypothetical protein